MLKARILFNFDGMYVVNVVMSWLKHHLICMAGVDASRTGAECKRASVHAYRLHAYQLHAYQLPYGMHA